MNSQTAAVSLQCGSDLFGSVLGVGRQVVEGVVGLGDAAEEHCDHTCNTKTTEMDQLCALNNHQRHNFIKKKKDNALVDTCRELLLFVCTSALVSEGKWGSVCASKHASVCARACYL